MTEITTDPFVTRNGAIMMCDGVLFDLLNPRVRDIKIDVIAHGLAKKDRATGQYNRIWSVAEHSLFTAYAAEYYALLGGLSMPTVSGCMLKALLHDASEAYLVDLPRPVKYLPGFEEYRRIEAEIQDCIYQWAGFVGDRCDDIVHKADNEVLKCEFLWWLNGSERLEWVKDIDVDMVKYVRLRWPGMIGDRYWRESKSIFIDTYEDLSKEISAAVVNK